MMTIYTGLMIDPKDVSACMLHSGPDNHILGLYIHMKNGREYYVKNGVSSIYDIISKIEKAKSE